MAIQVGYEEENQSGPQKIREDESLPSCRVTTAMAQGRFVLPMYAVNRNPSLPDTPLPSASDGR